MSGLVSAVNAWKDLISKIFGQYPLAGALVTLLAVGAFLFLQKKVRPRKAATNFLLVFLGWAILVPLVGLVLTMLSKVWEFIEATAPIVAKVLGSFYSIYARHPLMVLVLCGLAFSAYFVWRRWWPNVLRSRAMRILFLAVVTLVAAFIAD